MRSRARRGRCGSTSGRSFTCAPRAPTSASASAPRGFVSLDERVLLAARTRGHTPAREPDVPWCSRLGEHAGVWLAIGAAGAAVDRRRRDRWRAAAATVVMTYALNTAIKL